MRRMQKRTMRMTGEIHQSEDAEQEALFSWARAMRGHSPCLELLFHIPNGGRRDAITGAALKLRGVKAGVPDICLPVARGKYHGLFIELKVGNNKPTAFQRDWLLRLDAQGYAVYVCYGWREAAEKIENYLKMGGYNGEF